MEVLTETIIAPTLRFREFDGEWEKKSIGDLYTSLRTGMTPSRRISDYFKGSIPWITSGELKFNTITDTIEKISKSAVSDTNLKIYPPNTFFIAITGLEAPGTRGKCALNGVPATTNQSCMAFTENDRVYTKFLFYWYTKFGIKLFFRFAQGTKQQSFNNKIVEKFEFSFPSLPEQKKIATFLSNVDEKLQQLKRKKDLLEEYKKGVMQKIFCQDLRFRDENGNDYPDWEEKRLGEELEYKSIRNKSNQVDLVLSVSNKKGFITQQEQFDGYQVASKDVANYKIVNNGEYAYNPSRINVGSIARLDSYEQGIVSPMYVIFKLKNSLNPIFFDAMYSTHRFKYLIKIGCSGSVRDSLNFDELEKFDIKLPCIKEQQKIADFLSAIDSKIELVNTQLEKTEAFKKGLLQQMFV